MALYNNKKQEQLFHLHDPIKSTKENCALLKVYFPDFLDCETSSILANPTKEFNCIGWAIGVKKFIDPTKDINKHYSAKLEYDKLTYSSDRSKFLPLYEYDKSIESCMKASKLFFEEYKESSVLPKKDDYIGIDHITDPPQDDTIAFYFKEGQDQLEENGITRKGFQYAARYVEDVNGWVSDIWSSKLGPQMLITHGEHELEGEIYGHILCYLVPKNTNTATLDHNEL
jgi:hypothetical protein